MCPVLFCERTVIPGTSLYWTPSCATPQELTIYDNIELIQIGSQLLSLRKKDGTCSGICWIEGILGGWVGVKSSLKECYV